jgi:signal transduction histidine kinase
MRVAALSGRITQLAVGRHLPHRTVRRRLTLLYGGLFLLSGAALMAITYALLVNAGFVFTLQQSTNGNVAVVGPAAPLVHRQSGALPFPGSTTHPSAQTMAHWRSVAQCMRRHGVSGFPYPVASVPPKSATSAPSKVVRVGEVSDRDGAILILTPAVLKSPAFTASSSTCGFMPDHARAAAQTDRRRTQTRAQLLVQSGIALAGMSLLSLGLGWLVAGRVLQPLGDSYEAQRQFVANASHELRAPLTRQRALIQVALANPEADSGSLRTAHERVLASEEQLEQLIDALLALTRGQAGLERREQLDLAALASQTMLARESELVGRDLDVHSTLAAAPALGDPRLVERLIANLIDNAIRHNDAGGQVEITTGTRERHAYVSVTNTGPSVPPEQIERLLQPFERLGGARTQHNSGYGLGLSIVQAIANAHHAGLSARPRPGGGLTVDVSFPPAPGATLPRDTQRPSVVDAAGRVIHPAWPDATQAKGTSADTG